MLTTGDLMLGLRNLPKLYRIGVRFPKTVLTVSLLLTLISFVGAWRLKIESDMTSLLPQGTQSVQDLNRLKKEFGGSGYLILTVETKDRTRSEGFADDLARRVEQHPAVRYVDYRRPVEYFKKRRWLYLDLEDLREMERRVDHALELEKKGVSSTFSQLVDFADEADRPDLSFKDILKKYEKRGALVSQDRTSGDDGRFVILRVKIGDHAENLDASRRLISDIRAIEQELRAHHPDPSIAVGYTGGYETKIERVDQTRYEIRWISLLVSGLLFLILFLYFRRVSAAFLVGVPLLASVIWTGGLVYLLLGHVNVITGFGAAILGGLGSDYGIYLLTRYYHERNSGRDFETSCRLAFANTGRATYASMITTVGAFVALLFSDFGVFVEFGVVGALGLVANYLAMMVIVPSLLAVMEKRGWRLFAKEARLTSSGFFHLLFAPRSALAGVIFVLLLSGVSSLSLPIASKINYDDGEMDSEKLPGNRLYERVSKVVNASLSPTMLIARGVEEEQKTVNLLESRLKSDPSGNLVYNNVIGLSSFIPRDQREKKQVLSRIREKFEKLHLILKSQKESFLLSLKDSLRAEPITRKNLPAEVTRLFTSAHQSRQSYQGDLFAVYLFPSFARTSSEAMKRYQEGVTSLKTELGLNFIAADGAFVAADTVRLIEREASRGMMLIVLFFSAVLLVMIRPPHRALIILANLMGSLILLSGLLWLTRIPLNIINIAVIPVVLGTGIDCFIHFSHRYAESGQMTQTLKSELPPMFISSLTSLVGFGGLILASNAGLRSVGWIAIFGLSLVTFLSAFVFPRCLALESAKRKAAEEAVPVLDFP